MSDSFQKKSMKLIFRKNKDFEQKSDYETRPMHKTEAILYFKFVQLQGICKFNFRYLLHPSRCSPVHNALEQGKRKDRSNCLFFYSFIPYYLVVWFAVRFLAKIKLSIDGLQLSYFFNTMPLIFYFTRMALNFMCFGTVRNL